VLIGRLPEHLATTMHLLSAGHTHADIATELSISEDTVRHYVLDARQQLLPELWDKRLTRWAYQVTTRDPNSLRVLPPHAAPFRIAVEVVPAELLPDGVVARARARVADDDPYLIEVANDIEPGRWVAEMEPVIDGIVTEYMRLTRFAELTGSAAENAEAVAAIRIARAIAGQRRTLDQANRPAFDRLIAGLTPSQREMLTRYVHGAEAHDIAAQHGLDPSFVNEALARASTSLDHFFADRGIADADGPRFMGSDAEALTRIADVVYGLRQTLQETDRGLFESVISRLSDRQRDVMSRYVRGATMARIGVDLGYKDPRGPVGLVSNTGRVLLARLSGRYPLALGGRDLWLRDHSAAILRAADVMSRAGRGVLASDDLRTIEEVSADLMDPQRQSILLLSVRGIPLDEIGRRLGIPSSTADVLRGEARVALTAYLEAARLGLTSDTEAGPEADAEAIYRLIAGVKGARLTEAQLAPFRELTRTLLPAAHDHMEALAGGLASRDISMAAGPSANSVRDALRRARQGLVQQVTDPQFTFDLVSIGLREGQLLIGLPSGTTFEIELATVPPDLLPTRSQAVRAFRGFSGNPRYRIEVSDQVDLGDLTAIINTARSIIDEILVEHGRMTRLLALCRAQHGEDDDASAAR
jgi:DNA-directed RNA polymerase specialized sigma24 family protein